MSCGFVLDDGGLRVAHTLGFGKESLGGAEAQVHVEAHGKVVEVVGDVERDHFLFLSLLIFHEGKDEAAVFGFAFLHFKGFFAPVYQRLFFHLPAIDHGEVDFLSHLVIGSIERTGAEHHTEHVIDAEAGLLFGVADFVAVGFEAQFHVVLASAIAVPGFVHRVAVSFEGSLPVVVGDEFLVHDADERVAQHEKAVGHAVSARDEVALVGVAALVIRAFDAHVGAAHRDPNEFPVEIELVGQVFAGGEGQVFCRALRLESRGCPGA